MYLFVYKFKSLQVFEVAFFGHVDVHIFSFVFFQVGKLLFGTLFKLIHSSNDAQEQYTGQIGIACPSDLNIKGT